MLAKTVVSKLLKFNLVFLLILALIVRILFSFYIFNFQHDRLVQDDYPMYADAMIKGNLGAPNFPDFDKRLFPTYSLLIAVIEPLFPSSLYAGIVVSILLSLTAIYLAYKLFNDTILVTLMAISPLAWLQQSSKVANEPLFIVFALASLLFFLRKKYFITGIIMGLAFATRPVALALLISVIIYLLQKQQVKQVSKVVGGFIIPILLLLLFNFIIFGPHEILQQFTHSDRYGQLRLGFIQIAQDFYRTLDWKQYKIFISGTFYVFTNLFALLMLILNRKKSDLIYICLLWFAATLLFTFTFSPFTLLDNFGRYALAALPAYLLGFSLFYRSTWIWIITKNKSHKEDEK